MAAEDVGVLRAVVDAPLSISDAELGRFVRLARGDVAVAANYYLDSSLSRLTRNAPDASTPERAAGPSSSSVPAAPRASPKGTQPVGTPPAKRGVAAGKQPVGAPSKFASIFAGRAPAPARAEAVALEISSPPMGTSAKRSRPSEPCTPEPPSSPQPAPARAPAPPTAPAAPTAPAPAGGVLYASVARTLSALAATRSRLEKEAILTTALCELIAAGATDAELLATCHLLAPVKDAQSGGHRLLPDWEAGDVLSLGRATIYAAVAEATGASAGALRAALDATRDVGDAAVSVRDGGGGQRQVLLVAPAALSVRAVYDGLLAVGRVSGADANRRRGALLVRLLRSARGDELRWLARTLPPHLSVGISLEGKVLPALGAAFACAAHARARPTAPPLDPASARARALADAARRCFAVCPRVDVLISRLRGRSDGLEGEGGAPPLPCALALDRFVAALAPEPAAAAAPADGCGSAAALAAALPPSGLDALGALRLGCPPQPMLAKPATSVAQLVRRLGGERAERRFCAEFKYDGQRAQLHIISRGGGSGGVHGGSAAASTATASESPHAQVRVFSRKLDEITGKFPDVCAAALAALCPSVESCLVDCEIVPVARREAAAEEAADEGGPQMLAFQVLSTRKRVGVTVESAAAVGCRVVVVAFDLLQLNGRALLAQPFETRRALLRAAFPAARPSHGPERAAGSPAFMMAASLDVGGGGDGGDGGDGGGGGGGDGGGDGGDAHASNSDGQGGGEGDSPRRGARGSDGDRAIDAKADATTDDAGVSARLAAEARVERQLAYALRCGAEGLMCKRLDSGYTPDSLLRNDAWAKLKKDYVDGLSDSLDLVPIGGWRGDGRKSAWVSPWLLACYDPESGRFQSVCRVMSGFTDAFYAENTRAFLGVADVGELRAAGAAADDAEGEDAAAADADDERAAERPGAGRLVRGSRPDEFATAECCRFWFEPCADGQPFEVWEVRGAELSVSPVHHAAIGLVDSARGLSLRFPRFVRKREDKGLEGVTTAAQLAAMYRAQQRQQQQPAAEPAPRPKSGSLPRRGAAESDASGGESDAADADGEA